MILDDTLSRLEVFKIQHEKRSYARDVSRETSLFFVAGRIIFSLAEIIDTC